jgi:hypothetical protein
VPDGAVGDLFRIQPGVLDAQPVLAAVEDAAGVHPVLRVEFEQGAP